MDIIAKQLGDKLVENKTSVSVAESCTGGLVCKMMTDVAGSSLWFDRGFITYTNEAKVSMLNVSPATLTKYGAVSLQTVEEMAKGALANSQAGLSLAISGIAGPSGGSVEKPVGTVCFAWRDKRGKSLSELKLFTGDREEIRSQAAIYAIEVILQQFFD